MRWSKNILKNDQAEKTILEFVPQKFNLGTPNQALEYLAEKKVGSDLRERRVQHGNYSLKLMDAIDASANSLARAYEQMSADSFWVPELPLLN